MKKNLPARPNLEHLRRQAKELLSALASRETAAAETIQKYLPSAKKLGLAQVLKNHYRLADAQSAIARKTGFAAWPHLARHVEQLRALEGTWSFARLEVDGSMMPAGALAASRILIDGDRFRSESPEASYEGIFNINVETDPHEIDIEFVEGPEAGNWNYGIFRVDGEQLEICLDLNGRPRPDGFRTSLGSGRAYETLTRASRSRPEKVTGGTPTAPRNGAPSADIAGFEYQESATLTRLQGEWTATRLVRDGQEFPPSLLRTGSRTAAKNEIKVMFAGQMIIHALVRLDETTDPVRVDYCNIGGAANGSLQQGILKWMGDEACFCMSGPGQDPPSDFNCPAGSGQTLSQWRPRK
jgi:uncharacterized protein (TIGR03067 family)